ISGAAYFDEYLSVHSTARPNIFVRVSQAQLVVQARQRAEALPCTWCRFALRRPISLLTMVVAAALVGFLALDRMSRDIFPDLGVPVLYVAQPYGGLDPAQMEGFITNYYEYHFLFISGIEHVESKSIQGVALIKLQFH